MTAAAGHAHEQHDHDHEHARERRMAWAKMAILLGLGLYFTFIILSGNLSNYINLRFGWLSYVAAGLFFLLGGFSLYTLLRSRGEHKHAHDDHLHSAPSWGVIAIVAIPLVLGTLVPSQPLGVEAVSSIDLNAAASQVSTGNATLFTINPENRNVLDWLRVFNQTDDYSTLDNQPVDISGFVYNEPDFGDDQFMTARFTISCCVADANAIGLPVVWTDTDLLPQGEWVRVRGTMQTGEFRGETTALVYADSVEIIEAPQNPYLYP